MEKKELNMKKKITITEIDPGMIKKTGKSFLNS